LIEIRRLSKSYGGKNVLDDVTVSIPRGIVTGLLGPNGAGKTTLLSILTGVIGKDGGSVVIGGFDLDREPGRIQNLCSYVPQSLAFYTRLSARENLEYFGSLRGLKGKHLKERMAFCIDVGSMQAFVDKRVDAFSGGMKRRLNLAIGLLNEPEILYLDEPTVGVDAQSRSYILEVIRKINRDRGTTVVYTSHYMDEIEQVSDEIAVIDGGRIILHEGKQAVLTRADAVMVTVGPVEETTLAALRTREGIWTEKQRIHIRRDGRLSENMAAVFALLHQWGVRVDGVAYGQRTLEELFLKLTDNRLRDTN